MGSSWHSYPKVYALGHRATKDLFDTEYVYIQEKVDGSQFSFGVHDGELKIRSRGGDIYPETPQKLFTGAVRTVVNLFNDGRLKEGWTYRGEVLQSPRHNVLTYERIPEGHIYLFDVELEDSDFLYHEGVYDVARSLGLEPVSSHQWGCKTLSREYIDGLLKQQSILGGVTVEGLVFKRMPDDQIYGADGKVIIGKYVSEKFKEVADKEWKKVNPTRKDIIEQLKERYRTEARWQKSVQHLDEAGLLQHAPQDIGIIIKAIQEDIKEEASDEIAKILAQHFMPSITGSATAGFAEWYKEKLLERQFEETIY